jgi:hypothetical protein
MAIEECQICLMAIDTASTVKLQCCHQTIHKDCFLKWLSYKGIDVKCPICRSEIHIKDHIVTLSDVQEYYNNNSNKDKLREVLIKVYDLPMKPPIKMSIIYYYVLIVFTSTISLLSFIYLIFLMTRN